MDTNGNIKKLLLKDLSSRLPYGVIVHLIYDKNTMVDREMGLSSLHNIVFNHVEAKPYLRPMYSMTYEERFEYNGLCNEVCEFDHEIISHKIYDWLDAHHFDYRGLIPMGLAIEAPEGMYN